MRRCWYAYDGIGDPFLASSYIIITVKPGCINGCTVCAIYVPACDVNPSSPLSQNMMVYIANLLATCIAQPSLPPGAKKYVYGKDV